MLVGKKYNRVKGLNDYSKIHWWLRYNYGKADKCENSKCENLSNKYEWAKLADKEYEKKRENFHSTLQLRCHRIYDSSFNDKRPSAIKNNRGYARGEWRSSESINQNMEY